MNLTNIDYLNTSKDGFVSIPECIEWCTWQHISLEYQHLPLIFAAAVFLIVGLIASKYDKTALLHTCIYISFVLLLIFLFLVKPK